MKQDLVLHKQNAIGCTGQPILVIPLKLLQTMWVHKTFSTIRCSPTENSHLSTQDIPGETSNGNATYQVNRLHAGP